MIFEYQLITGNYFRIFFLSIEGIQLIHVALFNIQEFTVFHDHIDVGIILLGQHHLMITVTPLAACAPITKA